MNGQIKWPRGRVLGGTSSINGMVYTRGSKHDFDRWASYTGDQTWNYNHVLSYFKRSEKALDYELYQSIYHGRDGPLGVKKSNSESRIAQKIIQGFQKLGYSFNEDYNGKTVDGISVVQQTIENGERSSTSKAFLRPFLDRLNLDISLKSRVQKVLISNKTASGVEVIKNGKKYVVRASREVILSAGSIETPQILMLSGIGPKKHLEELHIPGIANLPVGENLQFTRTCLF
jgi:choline dehydrogenase-like flavoprotein